MYIQCKNIIPPNLYSLFEDYLIYDIYGYNRFINELLLQNYNATNCINIIKQNDQTCSQFDDLAILKKALSLSYTIPYKLEKSTNIEIEVNSRLIFYFEFMESYLNSNNCEIINELERAIKKQIKNLEDKFQNVPNFNINIIYIDNDKVNGFTCRAYKSANTDMSKSISSAASKLHDLVQFNECD
jgi:ribosome-associated translation inhibitor RaiA